MKADQDPYVQTAIRVLKSTLVRADKLSKHLSQRGRRTSRSDALRMAMFEGLSVLENEARKEK